MVTRAAWRRSALLGFLALGVGCGTVLGLGDYQNAPADTGPNDAQSGSADGQPPANETGGEDADNEATGGDGASDAEGTDESSLDAATGQDAPPSDAARLDGGYVVPPGWSVVAFAPSPQTMCPAGFSANPTPVVFGTETPATNACSCDSCSVSTGPSCVVGQIGGGYDLNTSRTCTTVSQPLANANPGTCNTDNPHGKLFGSDVEWTPPGPSGGMCTAPAPVAHANRVSFAGQGLTCAPTAATGCDEGGVCSPPALAAPFTLCVAAAGNVGRCPAGPFTLDYGVVGSGATFSCSGSCGCSVEATCTNGTVTYFRDGACTAGSPLVMPANGTCNGANGGGATFGSYTYSATVSGVTCQVMGTPATTGMGLADEETICCMQ
jgi:hypothetical protein